MRRKLYSSRRVKKTALVYTQDTEKEILAAKLECEPRKPALVRVINLAASYRAAELAVS